MHEFEEITAGKSKQQLKQRDILLICFFFSFITTTLWFCWIQKQKKTNKKKLNKVEGCNYMCMLFHPPFSRYTACLAVVIPPLRPFPTVLSPLLWAELNSLTRCFLTTMKHSFSMCSSDAVKRSWRLSQAITDASAVRGTAWSVSATALLTVKWTASSNGTRMRDPLRQNSNQPQLPFHVFVSNN